MGVTVFQLRGLNPSTFRSVGFQEAEPLTDAAARSFDGQVRRVVTSGAVWSGEGQPQAAAVMRTNSLGLDIAKVQMKAGALAVKALATAVGKAKKELDDLEAEAASKHDVYFIDDAGTVHYGESRPGDEETPAPPGPAGPSPNQVDAELTHRVQAVLNYVDHADLTTAGVLNRIANSRPAFAGSIGGGSLTYNGELLGLAYSNLGAAVKATALWTNLSPHDWGGEIPSPLEGAINGAIGALLPGWDDVQNKLGETAVEAGLDESGDELALRAIKRANLALSIGGTVWGGLNGARIEERLPDLPGPTNLVPLRENTYDADLQGIVDDYYLDPSDAAAQGGFATLDQALRLQRSGQPDAAGEDYYERARELRGRLDDWLEDSHAIRWEPKYELEEQENGEYELDEHPNPPYWVEEDRKIANDLRDRLDDVLADRGQGPPVLDRSTGRPVR